MENASREKAPATPSPPGGPGRQRVTSYLRGPRASCGIDHRRGVRVLRRRLRKPHAGPAAQPGKVASLGSHAPALPAPSGAGEEQGGVGQSCTSRPESQSRTPSSETVNEDMSPACCRVRAQKPSCSAPPLSRTNKMSLRLAPCLGSEVEGVMQSGLGGRLPPVVLWVTVAAREKEPLDLVVRL